MINTHTAAFQGNDLIVLIHQTKGYENGQQDTDRDDLDDNQRQF